MTTKIILSLIRRNGPMSLNEADWTHAPDMLAKVRSMVASGVLVEGTDRHGAPGYACLPEGVESESDIAAAAYETANDAHIRAMVAYVKSPTSDNLAGVWDTAKRDRAAWRALLAVS